MQTIVVQVVSDDKFTDGVFRFRVVENSCEPETDLLIDPLEKVFFGRFGHQLVNVPQRVFF